MTLNCRHVGMYNAHIHTGSPYTLDVFILPMLSRHIIHNVVLTLM